MQLNLATLTVSEHAISTTPQPSSHVGVGSSATVLTKSFSPSQSLARGSLRRAVSIGGFGVVMLALFAIPVDAFVGAQASGTGGLELSIGSAIVLGLVEGITEYLPVSSTGHLLVTNELLGLNVNDEAERLLETYAICIQAGAILAVFVVYRDRIKQLFEGLLGKSEDGKQLLIALIASFIPTAFIAVVLFELFRAYIFGPVPIAAAWIVGGIVILWLSRIGFFERAGAELESITIRQAVLIGVLQTAAVWPGTSRSLVTIIGGVLVGLTLRAAVEYAFLLGLITLSAATVFAGLSDGPELVSEFGYFTPLVGLVVAFVSAVAAVRWMVAWLNEKGFDVFGWYRIAAGVILLGLVAAGTVNA